ncbi:MAG: type 1 glycerol-3-phosphate oxidase [Turicibacter sp.]|nr:type 1 glycerol-3-phosphate oxidase [Turicibacter sp.]
MLFSAKTRQENIQKLQEGELDLLIIGGGITGSGVALQAAASKVKTGLIEMQDFSEGTSSRSTKLVHGGIRYMKSFDVEVLKDTVGERAIVQRVAPHIPRPAKMVLPLYEEEAASTFSMLSLKIAMGVYDQLAGIEGTELANRLLSPEEVLELEPHLKKEGLLGGGCYLDFINNDARLVIDNLKKAAEDGALLASRVKAIGFLYEGDKIVGVKARDVLSGEVFEVRSKYVLNASGPWVDKVRNLNFKRAPRPKMRPTKGVHLVVTKEKLPITHATYFDSGYGDGRMIFALPRENKTYFGTTDTDYHGDLANPQVTQEDLDYLLGAVELRYPGLIIGKEDIESSWAGLRPLLNTNSGSDYNGGDNGFISDKSFQELVSAVVDYKEEKLSRGELESILKNLEGSLGEKRLSPSAVSRGSSLEREEDGLITLSGGKITDYRKMGEGALGLVIGLLKEEHSAKFDEVDSTSYAISGGEFDPTKVEETMVANVRKGVEAGLTETEATYIANYYGMNCLHVFGYADEMDAYPGLSLAESARLKYALEHEMVLTAADYFIRRTNHVLFGREKVEGLIDPVLDAMGNYLGWSEEERQNQGHLFKAILEKSDLKGLK